MGAAEIIVFFFALLIEEMCFTVELEVLVPMRLLRFLVWFTLTCSSAVCCHCLARN